MYLPLKGSMFTPTPSHPHGNPVLLTKNSPILLKKREIGMVASKNNTKLHLGNPEHDAQCTDGFKMKFPLLLRHVNMKHSRNGY